MRTEGAKVHGTSGANLSVKNILNEKTISGALIRKH
jgi:hypothetical protein